MMTDRTPAPAARCITCRKWVYLTRRDARLYARRWHPGEKISVYKACNSNGFHLGHRPANVGAIREFMASR
jgi:hypothetical protein